MCFIVIVLTMSNCWTISYVCHKSIDKKLENDIVPFDSLPVEVKEFFYAHEKLNTNKEMLEFYNNSQNVPLTERQKGIHIDLLTFHTTYEYKLEVIDFVKDLWNSHYLLIDKTNKITYRIDYTCIPSPVIVYGGEIFIPKVYNIYSVYRNKLETVTFDRYSLDSDRRYRRIWKKETKKIGSASARNPSPRTDYKSARDG